MNCRLKYFTFLLCNIIFILSINLSAADSLKLSGFRASRILQSYPQQKFPPPEYWISAGNYVSSKFNGHNPAGIWIVSLYISNGVTQLNFPNSTGKTYPYINFISQEQNEEYLSKFDTAGIKVWLQIEPGAASIDTLIDIVLNRYKHHSCVIGFGIDVEWYQTNTYPGGKKVTDQEAQKWEQKVKSINQNYQLFLKHYGQSWMPPVYRGNILFIDDSQEFTSSNPLTQMTNEFKSWGQKFYPNKVGFQIGYPKDSSWWQKYSDPASVIGNTLISNIPNCNGIFWVDFTINKIFPVTRIKEFQQNRINDFELYQNYPNPFNNETNISFYLKKDQFIQIYIFNIKGEFIRKLKDDKFSAGLNNIKLNAAEYNLSSGVYVYVLKTNEGYIQRKMIYLK